ncbi:MAG: hypothetical protein LBD54_00070 [Puniceicoccales bacterium]|jgi:hypothetical protein|nr:hypothetical protein [Puniceicoccales bacterium]
MSDGPYLCLDAATIFPQMGVLEDGRWLRLERFPQARAEALWGPIRDCFPRFSWAGFVYNSGPGGTLGLHSVLMMIRVWKTLPAHRSVPVGHYNGFQIASRLEPKCPLLAQPRRGELWEAKGGEVLKLSPEKGLPPGARRFPTQALPPPALAAYEALDYDLRPAAALLASSIRWDDAWQREADSSISNFVPWDGRRHGGASLPADER